MKHALRARTYKQGHLINRRVKTFRQGRRGLHEFLQVYNGITGFNNSPIGLSEFRTTYGEITEGGIQIISDKFKELKHGKVFYDLGSGIGKVVLGMAFLNENLQSRGVEIVPERIRANQQALERVKRRQITERIQIRLGSILDSAILNLADADWVFFSNLCLDADTNEGITRALGAMKAGSVVICSRELPFPQGQFHLIERIIVPMTWSSNSSCYVYKRLN